MTASRKIYAPRRGWTDMEVDLIRARYPHEPTQWLAEQFRVPVDIVYRKARQLGLRKSDAFNASPASARLNGIVGGTTRFTPGMTPWNRARISLPADGQAKRDSSPVTMPQTRSQSVVTVSTRKAPCSARSTTIRAATACVGAVSTNWCGLLLTGRFHPNTSSCSSLAVARRRWRRSRSTASSA